MQTYDKFPKTCTSIIDAKNIRTYLNILHHTIDNEITNLNNTTINYIDNKKLIALQGNLPFTRFDATSNLDLDYNKIINLATPTIDTDASTKKYVDDSLLSSKTYTDNKTLISFQGNLPFTRLNPTTNLDVSYNKIINLTSPSLDTDASTKKYVDDSLSSSKNYTDSKTLISLQGNLPITRLDITTDLNLNYTKIINSANPINYNDLANKGYVDSMYYPGDYKQSAQNNNHGSWLLCNGQTVSRTIYSTLFTIIGTSFGSGDGTTTFNLPDCRGRILGSIGQGAGLSNRTIGMTIGEETHTLTLSEIPSHKHNYSDAYFAEAGGTIGNNVYGVSAGTDNDNQFRFRTSTGGWSNNEDFSLTTLSTGGDNPHNIMQPTIFCGNIFIHI